MNNKWIEPLKKEWEKNPMTVIVVTALASNAFAKVLNAWTAAKSRRAYAKQVNYRIHK